MAIDYALGVATDLTPSQILKIMCGTGEATPDIKTLPERPRVFHLITTELDILAFQVDNTAPPAHRLWVEGLGVSRSVQVVFPNAEDSHASSVAMLRAIMNLMEQTQDDLALLYHSVVLVRNSGKLALNQSHELWRPEYLKLITVRYEMKNIPTP